MAIAIISRKIIIPFKHELNRLAYRVKGAGNDYDEFYDWLSDRKSTLTRTWSSWPWNGWEFTNTVDDVEIRIRWAEHMQIAPDHYDHQAEQGLEDVWDRQILSPLEPTGQLISDGLREWP